TLRFNSLRPQGFFLITVVAATALAVHAQPASSVLLPGNFQGSAAITALGDNLPTVAQAHGLDAQKLQNLLSRQKGLGVDRRGSLIFACEGLAVAPQGLSPVEQTLSSDIVSQALGSGSDTDALHLHSFPGANRVIYLDFDGHTTSGTQWNTSYTSGNP